MVSMGMGTSFLTNGMVPRCVQQGREQHAATSKQRARTASGHLSTQLLERSEASSSAPANSSKRARSVKMDIHCQLHLLSPSAHAA